MLKKISNKITSIILLFAMLFGFCFLTNTQLAQANFDVDIQGKAAIVIDADSGRILYQKNMNEIMFPASTTKIVTAMLALENLNLDDKVTVPSDFVNCGESSIWLCPGEQHTVKNLLYALMIRSANDSAQVLATSVAGNEADFVNLMNQKVADLNLKNTHFMNPHGLHNPNHYTTAYDLAMLAKAATETPGFSDFTNQAVYTIPGPEGGYERVLHTTNKLLGKYAPITGIKTGYTKQAGNCFVSSASKNGINLITVVLNSYDVFNDTKSLLDYCFTNYKVVKLCDKGSIKEKIKVKKGDCKTVSIDLEESLTTLLNKNESIVDSDIKTLAKIDAPIKKGQVLGSISYKLSNGDTIERNLVATKDVNKYKWGNVFKTLWLKVWGS